MNLVDVLIIVIIPLGAVLAAVMFGVILPRFQRRRRLHGPIPVALGLDRDIIPPRPDRPLTALHPASPANVPYAPPVYTVPPGFGAPGYPASPGFAAPPGFAPPAPQPPPVYSQTPVTAPPQVQVAAATGTDHAAPTESRAITSETPHLRLATTPPDINAARAEGRLASRRKERPLEGTLQFLPGRLEIVDGRDVGQEIRFVRQPGEETTVITFGRSEGAAYRHVQLNEPTVSRVHARISLEGKQWRLTNMSKTNPVVVNGEPLDGEEASRVLTEGDRVEMGEVVFKFRSK